MTLAEALEKIREPLVVQDTPAPDGAVLMASGGLTLDADCPPFLCTTQTDAVRTWHDFFMSWAISDRPEKPLVVRWAEPPSMYKFEVTTRGPDGTHRLQGARYAVVCRAWVGTEEQSDALPAAAKPARSGAR